MNKGFLKLSLPDGENLEIGDKNASIKANLYIKDPQFFKCVVLYGDIGFGEAYVDELWDTDSITQVIKWVILNIENAPSVSGSKVKSLGLNIFKWFNRIYHNGRSNTITGSQKNIAEHYDLNNDFFATFLDPSMTYSAAYFKSPDLSLAAA
ncbi:MAG: class I SAM-dependent methyltransferase, partial [Bacteroidia bacterium]